jgi:uncharacterized protein YcaQ
VTISLTRSHARRIAVAAQGLDRDHRPGDVLDAFRRLGCIQIDPLNVVARTQMLVLHSRLGAFDHAELEEHMWDRRTLFHYWAHAASIVCTEDFPIYRHWMKRWPGDGDWGRRVETWIEDNAALRRHILAVLKRSGTARARDFEDRAVKPWESSGWTHGQNVSRMLDFMWTRGELMVAGRHGVERVWARSDMWFPDWTPRDRIGERKVVERAAVRSLKALGIATAQHISKHFTANRYPGLNDTIETLLRRDEIVEIGVDDLRGKWFMHRDLTPLLDETGAGWRGRTVALSPFDNLIRDRTRTRALFDFDFTIEIYVPKAKRRYGYYVLPVLDGERLVGRIDPRFDRKSSTLVVNAVHAEDDALEDPEVPNRVHAAVQDLARWIGATDIDFVSVPPRWAPAFP